MARPPSDDKRVDQDCLATVVAESLAEMGRSGFYSNLQRCYQWTIETKVTAPAEKLNDEDELQNLRVNTSRRFLLRSLSISLQWADVSHRFGVSAMMEVCLSSNAHI
jgi:hypothetical protein